MIFSVIIAVRNEIAFIDKCLPAVFAQDFTGDYEVIVVDGMSNDGTFELLETLQKKYTFTLIKNQKLNAAVGRNLGIQQAKGDFIVFIDGDAIPATDWLTQIKEVFDRFDDAAGVGGPDLLPQDGSYKEKSIGIIMTSPIARGGKFNPSTQHSLMNEEKYVEHIPTCNLALKRLVFEKIGYFDEQFVKGQDLELNYRLIKSGFKLVYSPKIRVIHYRKNHVRDFAKQIYKWAKAKVAIIRKHGFNGFTSHVYIWPFYLVFLLVIGFAFFYFIKNINIYIFLLLFGFIFYISMILFESGRLAKSYGEFKLFFYSILLLPIVHVSYSFGIFYAMLRKKIW